MARSTSLLLISSIWRSMPVFHNWAADIGTLGQEFTMYLYSLLGMDDWARLELLLIAITKEK